jgi:hypothetical protein
VNRLSLFGPRLELLSADKEIFVLLSDIPKRAVIAFLFRFFLQDTRRQIPEDCDHQGFFLFEKKGE